MDRWEDLADLLIAEPEYGLYIAADHETVGDPAKHSEGKTVTHVVFDGRSAVH